MGADSFEDYGSGATVAEAFHAVVERALWEHGHGGYSGTIAEKGQYALVNVPAGTDVRGLVDTLSMYGYWKQQAGRDSFEHHNQMGKDEAKAKIAEAKAKFPGIDLSKLTDIYGDKWGPCLAIPTEPVRKMVTVTKKSRYGTTISQERGDETEPAWVFCGLASS